MCLGALIDAGVPLAYLQEQLAGLGLPEAFDLQVAPTQRQGQRALKVTVQLGSGPEAAGHHHGAPHRHLPDIQRLITAANLPDRARAWSLSVFQGLAAAEAAVHGIAVEQVHFHEVGATDAIVDIVGTCLGLDYLNIDQIYCSALPTGEGRVKAAHGWLPLPAPAVLKLMEQRAMPLYSNGCQGELVTPTGAAIVAALAQGFGPPPAMVLQRVGLGAGGKDLPLPNILRLWIGGERSLGLQSPLPAPAQDSAPPGEETVVVLETQVDDMVPQVITYLYDQLFAAGALDVFTQAIAMKKSRPGLLITAIAPVTAAAACREILFAETSTLGVRQRQQQRTVLRRDIQVIPTPHGQVSIKLAYHPQTGELLNVHPEYEDCAALAHQHQLPWHTIYQAALVSWYQHSEPTRVQH
jgi:uncharacterized protein (TIGR00299 family) protein